MAKWTLLKNNHIKHFIYIMLILAELETSGSHWAITIFQ